MDTTKGAAILSNNKGPLEDYAGVEKVDNLLPPIFCVPNTHGTGGEVAPAMVARNKSTNKKYVIYSRFLFPKTAILDPNMVYLMPQRLAVIDSFDALAHAVESVCASTSHPLSEINALAAIELIGINIRRACTTHEKQPALLMQLAASLALFAVSGTKAGLIHAAAFALEGIKDIPHGIACAIFMPYVMEFNALGDVPKFAQIAQFLGEKVEQLPLLEQAYHAANAVKAIYKDLKIPQSLTELGVPKDAIPDMAKAAMNVTRLMGNNPREMMVEDVQRIYENAL